jgi:hypothetical protein
MKRVFNYYTDSGHGWVKVPVNILRKLGIEKQVTTFSYWRKGFAYIEEDTDMATFMEAHPEKDKLKFHNFHSNNSSRIRNYETYKKELA